MDQAQTETIIELATDGKTVRDMVAAAGVSLRALYAELDTNESFRERYRRARELGIESQVDEMLDIARNEPDVNRARVVTDVIKWSASKRKPGTYGDKITMDISGQVDLTAIMADSAKRLRPMRDLDIADAQLVTMESSACDARAPDNVSDAGTLALQALLE